MLRVVKDLLNGTVLNNLPLVHHRHLIADVVNHAEVVSDKYVGQVKLLLNIPEQVDYLRLYGNIQRGNRLVGNNQ